MGAIYLFIFNIFLDYSFIGLFAVRKHMEIDGRDDNKGPCRAKLSVQRGFCQHWVKHVLLH